MSSLNSLLADSKTFYSSTRPAANEASKTFTSADFEKAGSLIGRIQQLPPAEQSKLQRYQNYFTKFQAIYLRHAVQPTPPQPAPAPNLAPAPAAPAVSEAPRVDLNECKALYTELKPKGGQDNSYSNDQLHRVSTLLDRIKLIPVEERNAFKFYTNWFLQFQTVFIKYAQNPEASDVLQVVKNLADNGHLEKAMQMAVRFQGGSLEQHRLYTAVAGKVTSYADVQKIADSLPDAKEKATALNVLFIAISIRKNQLPAEELLRFPGDDSHFDSLTKCYLSMSRPDLARQSWDRIQDGEKKDTLLKYLIYISYPEVLGKEFPNTPDGFFLNKWEPTPVIPAPVPEVQPQQAVPVASPADPVIAATPSFDGYRVAKGVFTDPLLQGNDPVLTGISSSPAHMLFNRLMLEPTMPAQGMAPLFSLNSEKIRGVILNGNPNAIVGFSANGIPGRAVVQVGDQLRKVDIPDLATVFGPNAYQISRKELQDTLNSQKIYTTQELPVPFYLGLKKALVADGHVLLPDVKLNDLATPACKAFLEAAKANPTAYGFAHKTYLGSLLNLTMYEIGAMVVKTEDTRILADGEGRIFAREAGANDAIRLINMCGIRNMRINSMLDFNRNEAIMRPAFETSLIAAEKDFVIFPAVGMGVWGGDPGLYWRDFLAAVVNRGHQLDTIFVNPVHQPTPANAARNHFFGNHVGSTGAEFQTMLEEKRRVLTAQNDQKGLANLAKIKIVPGKDIAQLAHNLKQAFPDKTVSLVNASDPDVTLGNHVGQYTNRMPHVSTTEENYTRMMTNGLCFESVTGVHQDPKRLIHVPH